MLPACRIELMMNKMKQIIINLFSLFSVLHHNCIKPKAHKAGYQLIPTYTSVFMLPPPVSEQECIYPLKKML